MQRKCVIADIYMRTLGGDTRWASIDEHPPYIQQGTFAGCKALCAQVLTGLKLACTCTAGIRVDPPTMITSSILLTSSLASSSAWRKGTLHLQGCQPLGLAGITYMSFRFGIVTPHQG